MFPITDGFTYLALLFFVAGTLKYFESHTSNSYVKRFFNYIPAVVCLYIITMAMGSLNIWELTPEIKQISSKNGITSYLLPPMIFLLLLKGDLREILKLGPRMIAVFVIAAGTMMIGFIVGYLIFKSVLAPDAWKPLAALCGSWIGGTVNMLAIQGAVHVPDADMGYVLAIDTISYSSWLLLMLLLVPTAKMFDRWTNADGSKLEKIIKKLERQEDTIGRNILFADIIFLIGLAMVAGVASFKLADLTAEFMTPYADKYQLISSLKESSLWQVVFATLLGLAGGMTKFGKIPGTQELGNTMLFFFIAVIGAKVNLNELHFGTMTMYIMLGFVVLVIHFVLLTIAAKIFKFDAFSCQTASLANIGGIASATVISSAYSSALVPIGVLMATLGTILGTGCGLIVAKCLEMLQ